MAYQNVQNYKRANLHTATPGQILIALYDGAIRFGHQAQLAIKEGRPAQKGVALGRLMAIVAELTSSLKHEEAPELCANLEALYNYMIERMHIAGSSMTVEPLEEVTTHLTSLRGAWVQAVQQAEAGGAKPAGGTGGAA